MVLNPCTLSLNDLLQHGWHPSHQSIDGIHADVIPSLPNGCIALLCGLGPLANKVVIDERSKTTKTFSITFMSQDSEAELSTFHMHMLAMTDFVALAVSCLAWS